MRVTGPMRILPCKLKRACSGLRIEVVDVVPNISVGRVGESAQLVREIDVRLSAAGESYFYNALLPGVDAASKVRCPNRCAHGVEFGQRIDKFS